MKLPVARALSGAWLVLGCAAGRVDAPPPPPGFEPESTRSASDATEPTPASEAAAKASQETPASEPPEPENPPLGWIAGQPLEAEELLLEWGDVSSRELFLVLDKLVAARLALAEAGRLGIRLAPEAVEQRFAAEKVKLEQEIARGVAAGKREARPLDEFIARELGFEPARYLERVRRATIRQMLAERAVRAASLASETVAVRLIVVADDAQRDKVAAALAAGQDFGAVARELSVDDSRENGGLVPFVVPQERSPLARLAFQTPVGETAGPLPIADHQFWIRVEERRTAVEGDWTVVAAPVEASLAEHPVEDAEFVHWKLAMEGRYPIDLGPLWSLIGAAR